MVISKMSDFTYIRTLYTKNKFASVIITVVDSSTCQKKKKKNNESDFFFLDFTNSVLIQMTDPRFGPYIITCKPPCHYENCQNHNQRFSQIPLKERSILKIKQIIYFTIYSSSYPTWLYYAEVEINNWIPDIPLK